MESAEKGAAIYKKKTNERASFVHNLYAVQYAQILFVGRGRC